MDQSRRPAGAPNNSEPGNSRARSISAHQLPTPIELKNADVEATWESHCLHGLLSLHWDRLSKTSLRLQFTPRNKLSFYTYIPPERVENLSVRNLDWSDPEKHSLDFDLSRESYLIMPGSPDLPWEPRDDISKKSMALVYNLAKQKRFTLSVKVSGRHMSLDHLHGFCRAISGGRIYTDTNRVNHRIVYSGRGKLVEGNAIGGDAGIATLSVPDAPAPGCDDKYTALDSAPAPSYDDQYVALDSAPAYSDSPTADGMCLVVSSFS